MIRRLDNQSPEDENLRIKRTRVELVEHNDDEEETEVPRIQNGMIENHHENLETAIEIVGDRAPDNASEDEDLCLFRALEEGSGSDHPNATTADTNTNDRGSVQSNSPETGVGSATASTNSDEEPHTIEVLSQTADALSASLIPEEAAPLTKPEISSKEKTVDLTADAIDLDAEEQQVLEISDEDFQEDTKETTREYGAAKDYRCPICFDPPETALMTLCGHVFCCSCLFQMVNSSRTCRQFGHCALCRSKVYLKDVRLMILRKKQTKKKTKS
ncbi:SUMO-targeted ubiquitin ligase complex subunit SLX8 SKDI_05G2100 [Saccharomyces kudriavzevii IFO 1802]|uniref:SLX8-like protein n=2 Tax=Saccharomyces kudriavzevii (strain ATCC MYA-4449 / AS 2.2408 / CBS 8840 / NBRC 1802 / NCYC 2889) TaxID=226230 RepID=J6EBY2_SACK1|nr:uncharacterized protein SKDI_05G2100 [Saccharomyces kudriavzevii IFO 1802]EJT41864.1 SLX8-like protein [Saccharomyces kudriavzevii IFO 1802]CAI4060532.1 hypothetical protein SKDI_05G2100 [Saccharomyces kudriavzevii IFO 1802]